jgi:transposase
VRVIDVFIDELDLSSLGFKTESNDTGRPPYHPAMMLKLIIYGYLNRVHASQSIKV